MEILKYITWGLALFFAGGWTFGLIVRPIGQLKCNYATVIFWWAEIVLAAFGSFNVFHLLWLLPLTLLIPWEVQKVGLRARLRTGIVPESIMVIFIKSAVPIGVALVALIY